MIKFGRFLIQSGVIVSLFNKVSYNFLTLLSFSVLMQNIFKKKIEENDPRMATPGTITSVF